MASSIGLNRFFIIVQSCNRFQSLFSRVDNFVQASIDVGHKLCIPDVYWTRAGCL